MLKEDMGTLTLKSNNTRARACDACRLNPSTIFCEADLAYLCTGCDSQVHDGNKLSLRHKRVGVCEACEQAPAAFICKADAASRCTTCDGIIHSANPLSQRHHRVPVMPFLGSVYGCGATEQWSSIGQEFEPQDSEGKLDNEDEDEAASWLIFDSPVKNSQGGTNESMFDGDEYLDLVDFNSCQDTDQEQLSYGGCDGDGVVPVQSLDQHQFHHHDLPKQKFQLGMEYERSNGDYGFHASYVQSVSISSVPDSSITEVSISNVITQKGTSDLFSSPSTQVPTQLTPMDREARVLRYQEKKKTRKFEKTIRYASQKAYAETRPKIKGRFAKGTNVDIKVDQMFSTTLNTEDGCFVDPTF
ncbi:zinc finger protein CONSTANS-LIKE 2-like [Bidens hawaiensis]|uniref:zinc finger protein CONSTANS-LIKE 2-like n=1 Tax=Bidens hawaiensis TaxID=980011 RepID=UPI00404A3FA8